jgi:hypothetical protein
MNMTFAYVPKPKGFEFYGGLQAKNLVMDMYSKKVYIALGNVERDFLRDNFFDITNTHYIMRTRWYVPCSVKYPRWSSIFRIFYLELWLVLIISIVIGAISTTLIGRYSCTSEWKGSKTLTCSLTNLWAVFLGLAVSTMPRATSLRSIFFAWICFSLAFSTVFQTFLTMFRIDSGYKTPIQNMDELFASDIKLAYLSGSHFIFEIGDETEVSNVLRYLVNCPSYTVCVGWAKFYKNVSVLVNDMFAEMNYAHGVFVGENSKPLICRLEDSVVYTTGLTIILFHGDPLLRRVSENIDRVVEAGIYKYWISQK